jgi:hypothetical protein
MNPRNPQSHKRALLFARLPKMARRAYIRAVHSSNKQFERLSAKFFAEFHN